MPGTCSKYKYAAQAAKEMLIMSSGFPIATSGNIQHIYNDAMAIINRARTMVAAAYGDADLNFHARTDMDQRLFCDIREDLDEAENGVKLADFKYAALQFELAASCFAFRALEDLRECC